MPFPFALSRTILLGRLTESWFGLSLTVSFLVVVVITNAISSVLSVIAFQEKTGGGMCHGQDTIRNDARLSAFQVLAICFGVLSLLTVVGW